MTRIVGKGRSEFGNVSITIIGDKKVKQIECSELIKPYVSKAIHNAEGTIANGFSPEADTMLQAFAYLTNVFGDDNVDVYGDLEEIPCDPGVIY